MERNIDDDGDDLRAAQLAALVELTAHTYRTVTEQRRRVAAFFTAVAVLFAVLGLAAGYQWLQTRQQAADVEDRPLIEALGVRIPDPRPSMERAALRVRGAVYGTAAVGALVVALLALGLRLLVAPSKPPPAAAALLRQPPIADISTRGSPTGNAPRSSE